MRGRSPAQLRALALIKFNGLLMDKEQLGLTYAAHLDLDPPNFETVNIATVRVLLRGGLIEPVPPDEERHGRDHAWRVSRDGNALLNEHKEYLPDASREVAHFQTQSFLFQAWCAAQAEERTAALMQKTADKIPG